MVFISETCNFTRVIKHVKLYKIILCVASLLLLVPLGTHYYLNKVSRYNYFK